MSFLDVNAAINCRVVNSVTPGATFPSSFAKIAEEMNLERD